jgi:large subunit ribosomal protein L24
MNKKLHIRRNDTVQVVSGEDKGARGRVLAAMPQKGKVIVEGVNMIWKHIKKGSRIQRSGGRIERAAPIQASKVMLLCQHAECKRFDKPVRTRTQVSADGAKARVCTKCGKPVVTPE